MFATGLGALPSLGLDEKITIYYREDTCPHFFAETCTMELKVPTVLFMINIANFIIVSWKLACTVQLGLVVCKQFK